MQIKGLVFLLVCIYENEQHNQRLLMTVASHRYCGYKL